ncbi:hypothetical protein SpCBS45565_g07270 [Spizellomyces sp. 'palustris']|nr:hypothetical protein SpCBS45565_g07270 [Spizellomyces sp. 'palustris']
MGRSAQALQVRRYAKATQDRFVSVDVRPGGYALVSIRREPVNSMNLTMWEQLLETLTTLEKDQVRGVIFHSGLSRPVFTAGNDLKELYAPASSQERYHKFWSVSNTFLARLSNSPLVTIAAIKGACPAGGTCLSIACDYRVITADGIMGLNEVALGIAVPAKWMKLMANVIGQAKTDKLTQFAKMVKAPEASTIGLVDEVVQDEKELLIQAQKVMENLLKLPDAGRQITKEILRGPLAREWADEKWLKDEADTAWKMLSLPSTVKALDGVFARLSKSKV